MTTDDLLDQRAKKNLERADQLSNFDILMLKAWATIAAMELKDSHDLEHDLFIHALSLFTEANGKFDQSGIEKCFERKES